MIRDNCDLILKERTLSRVHDLSKHFSNNIYILSTLTCWRGLCVQGRDSKDPKVTLPRIGLLGWRPVAWTLAHGARLGTAEEGTWDMALPVGGGPTGGWSSPREVTFNVNIASLGTWGLAHQGGDVDIECHLSGGEGPSASVWGCKVLAKYS